MAIFGIYLKFIGGNPLTLLGTNISFSQGIFESIIFRLSRLVGYVTFLEGITPCKFFEMNEAPGKKKTSQSFKDLIILGKLL